MLTLSLSRWMSLPDLDLRHWEKLVQAEQLERSASAANKDAQQETLSVHKTSSRVPVGTVAAYYKDYVHRKGLTQYFRWYVTDSRLHTKFVCGMNSLRKHFFVAAGPQSLHLNHANARKDTIGSWT